jgi:hypothetical protein
VTLPLGAKQPRLEADHSPPCKATFKNKWSYTSIPSYTFMTCTGRTLVCVVKKLILALTLNINFAVVGYGNDGGRG